MDSRKQKLSLEEQRNFTFTRKTNNWGQNSYPGICLTNNCIASNWTVRIEPAMLQWSVAYAFHGSRDPCGLKEVSKERRERWVAKAYSLHKTDWANPTFPELVINICAQKLTLGIIIFMPPKLNGAVMSESIRSQIARAIYTVCL